MNDEVSTRECTSCAEIKPLTKFAKTGDGKHRNNICRSCQHKKQKVNPRYVMSRMLSMARLRCEDPKNDSYDRYGGRGIEFKIDREEFYSKFEERVANQLKLGKTPSIDRVDYNGHYEMSNVQVVQLESNTAEMRLRLKDRYQEKRILAEQAPTKQCRVCKKDVETQKFYVSKHYKDGTISRYGACPDCEQALRIKKYSDKSYYKGRTA